MPRFKTPPWLRYAQPRRRWKNPEAELSKQLLAVDEQRLKAFLDVIAQLALEDAEREAERKRKYTVRIVPRLRIKSCA